MEVSGNVRSIVGRVEGNNGPERRGSDSESRPLHLLPTWPPTSPPSSCSKFSPPTLFLCCGRQRGGEGRKGSLFSLSLFTSVRGRGGGKKGQKGLEEKEVRKIPSSPSSNGGRKEGKVSYRKSAYITYTLLFRKKPPGYLHCII